MKKIVCISDSFPIHPRLEKISEYFSEKDDRVINIAWDRTSSYEIDEIDKFRVYKSRAKYGNKILKLIKLPSYILFIRKMIRKENPDLMICRHWPMFMAVSIVSHRETRIVYDVCDMPSNKFIRFIEKQFIKRANTIILSSRYFKEYYNHNNLLVLENRPKRRTVIKAVGNTKNEKFSITYLGKIRYFPILKNLVLSVVNHGNIVLNFYGDGPDSEKLKNYCEAIKANNVKFNGKYTQNDLSNIYLKSDLIWCAYPTDNFNVRYAISNKFFETLSFKKPGIFSQGTMLSNEIKKYNIGFLVNPYNVTEIEKLIVELSRDRQLIKDVVGSINNYNKPIYWDEYEKERL